jgi:DNA-binding response OmpR family regulator
MQAEHPAMRSRGSSSSRSAGAGGPNSARLGGARADFVAGLGRKVADLKGAIGRVRARPEDLPSRDELRRKLHALDSAAKMLKFDAMDRGLAEALGAIDRSEREAPLEAIDLDAIEQIIDDLPALAWGDGTARSSRAEALEAQLPRFTVLVVGSSLIAEALLLDDESPAPDSGAYAKRYDTTPPRRAAFVCESTPDAPAAFDLVRASEPDLVIVDGDVAGSSDLVAQLMDDPLTEAVPIVVVGSFLEPGESARYVVMGVAKTVTKPTSREALRCVCEDVLAPDRAAAAQNAPLGEPTLEELGDRLASELRDALVGRADPSARARRIQLGQGTEVLGAIWSAIARVREVVTARTDGQVRFGTGPAGALTPAPLLLDPDVARADRLRTTKRGLAAEVRLQGRRIVVADDDPGVVWFLADLLKTAGCVVHEAFDGQQALELAYKTSPDLVISDILMPNLDGFSLCRALRRDVALRDTPVILLSWKEDLLQRVRELGADAAGYVRKESDTRAIIARVREALRNRGRVEARLREDGEVRGRLDGISIRSLLEIVCATRPEARVSVRDATFLYEVEIRMGAPVKATRTDGDGGFVKGALVLTQLLGVGAGRFTVTTSSSEVETELEGNLAAQLMKPIARARAATALLTGVQTQTISRVRLDEEKLDDYLKATPASAQLVARRLANGAPPHELVQCGGCEPALLDDLLCDLANRGIVVGIEALDGTDMLRGATKSLLPHSDARAAFAPRAMTPSPIPAQEGACVIPDPSVPICLSPSPGSSIEDVILGEAGGPPSSENAPAVASAIDPPPVKVRTAPPPTCDEITGTPPVEQILALAEPTIVDDVVYHEHSIRIHDARDDGTTDPSSSGGGPVGMPVERGTAEAAFFERGDAEQAAGRADAQADGREDEAARHEPTPFVTVTSDEPVPPAPRRKAWPLVAFLAASGVVAWAVVHFSFAAFAAAPGSAPQPPEQHLPDQALPPPESREIPPPPPARQDQESDKARAAQDKRDEVYYTPVASETSLPAGHGVLDVSAPEGTVVLVDGKERARGSAKLPMASGNHEIRVKRPASPTASPVATSASHEEDGCTIDVRSSRVAHVKF